MQASLSSYIVVGNDGGNVRSVMTERKNRTTLAVETAAKNSASVKLSAVTFCVFNLYTTAPPVRQMANPVVDLCFRGLFP